MQGKDHLCAILPAAPRLFPLSLRARKESVLDNLGTGERQVPGVARDKYSRGLVVRQVYVEHPGARSSKRTHAKGRKPEQCVAGGIDGAAREGAARPYQVLEAVLHIDRQERARPAPPEIAQELSPYSLVGQINHRRLRVAERLLESGLQFPKYLRVVEKAPVLAKRILHLADALVDFA